MLLSTDCPESSRHHLQTLASFSDEHQLYASTPIHKAVFEEDPASAMRAAISRNPELVDTLDDRGRTPIHLVVSEIFKNPRPLLFELKYAGADICSVGGDGDPPLIDACHFQNVEAVKWLLEQGVDPNRSRSARFGMLPLHFIAGGTLGPNSAEIAQLLLDKKADCNARDHMDRTPLHSFASCNDASSLGLHCRQFLATLVNAGASLEATTRGRTPPLEAIFGNSSAPTLALINCGANFRACEPSGAGALHLAAWFCDAALLRLLRETGAIRELDPYLKTTSGNSPWDRFIYSINIPKEAIHNLMDPSPDRCLAFERLFVHVRDFHLREELDHLQQTEACLSSGEYAEARVNLDHLVTLREPKLLWSTDATMHTYRAIILQLQAENLEGALESMVEKREAILQELATSPWEMDSDWWHEWGYEPGATFEQWMKQDAIAQGWRREGLRRWRREHPVDWMTLHPDGCVTKGLFEIWEAFSDSDEDDVESEVDSCG